MKIEVKLWFRLLVANFYEWVIQKLVSQCNKCLHNDGNYAKNKAYISKYIIMDILPIKSFLNEYAALYIYFS